MKGGEGGGEREGGGRGEGRGRRRILQNLIGESGKFDRDTAKIL